MSGEDIAKQKESVGHVFLTGRMIRTVSVAATYLETLNPEQRRAVEHGVRAQDCGPGRPLLVIAGAGSGKTNTLAHRVAHLIVNAADPRRILLMTFSRRAAAEMTRRVERIARRVMGSVPTS
jgi:DNA helicase II / ATP-dependent DNA helicase PcrA